MVRTTILRPSLTNLFFSSVEARAYGTWGQYASSSSTCAGSVHCEGFLEPFSQATDVYSPLLSLVSAGGLLFLHLSVLLSTEDSFEAAPGRDFALESGSRIARSASRKEG